MVRDRADAAALRGAAMTRPRPPVRLTREEWRELSSSLWQHEGMTNPARVLRKIGKDGKLAATRGVAACGCSLPARAKP